MRNEEPANPTPIPVSCGGWMEEALRQTVTGPEGTAEVYEAIYDLPPDPWAPGCLGLDRVAEVVYEVRFRGERCGAYPEEAAAVAAAAALVGVR